jgi:hypothetical protein
LKPRAHSRHVGINIIIGAATSFGLQVEDQGRPDLLVIGIVQEGVIEGSLDREHQVVCCWITGRIEWGKQIERRASCTGTGDEAGKVGDGGGVEAEETAAVCRVERGRLDGRDDGDFSIADDGLIGVRSGRGRKAQLVELVHNQLEGRVVGLRLRDRAVVDVGGLLLRRLQLAREAEKVDAPRRGGRFLPVGNGATAWTAPDREPGIVERGRILVPESGKLERAQGCRGPAVVSEVFLVGGEESPERDDVGEDERAQVVLRCVVVDAERVGLAFGQFENGSVLFRDERVIVDPAEGGAVKRRG